MKIITRAVLDWDGNVVEEDSYDYSGTIAEAKSSGSSPTPVDPYEQAAAQYGLATGTADYNAALAHTDSSNPLGGSTWNVVGTDGTGNTSFGGYPTAFGDQNSVGSYGPYSIPSELGGGIYGFGGSSTGPSSTGSSNTAPNGGSGAPIYSQQTTLAPWANQMLESPLNTSNIPGAGGTLNTTGIAGLSNIDTSGIPGMPGGPNVSQNDYLAQQANYNQQMGYLQPQEALQSEQTQAQLEAEGAMPGSAAYNTGEQQLSQQQTFANQQAADSAIAAGNTEEQTLYGLGTQSLNNQLNLGNASLNNQLNYGNAALQNQLAERNAPISEYEQLMGNGSGGQVSAATPDISNAFNQQYQGELANYNANTATNNANTSAGAGLASAAIMALAYY